MSVGVKVSVPFAFRVTEPPATLTEAPTAIAVPSICVIVSASPSTSLSLPSTPKVIGVSSLVENVSFDATGASLTAATVID